jgi:hypothetical protein
MSSSHDTKHKATIDEEYGTPRRVIERSVLVWRVHDVLRRMLTSHLHFSHHVVRGVLQ